MAGLALGWLGSHSLKAEVCSSCRRWEHGIVKARSAATRQRAKQVGSSGLSPTSAEGEDTVSDRHLSVPALLGVFVAFGAAVLLIGRLVLAVMGWDQVDYADYGQSAESLAQNILVPDLIVTVLLLILVGALGWWFVFRETRRVSKVFWVFPAAIAVASLLNTDWGGLGDEGATYALTLAAAVLVVGVNEELMFRGVLLHGFRSHGSEVYAWLWSTGLFAIVHGLNILIGSPIGSVLPQILNAFMLGTVFYITKRVSGSLLVPIVLHALWDFSFFSHGGTDADIAAGGQTGIATFAFLAPVAVLVCFIAIALMHKQWTHPETVEAS